VGVVVSQNIVRAAAWLLFTLGGAAGIFFFLGADFVGATQLIVYVGGTLVLVVFGVMLTAQGPFVSLRASAAEWAMSLIVGLLLLGVLIVAAGTSNWPGTSELAVENRDNLVNAEDPATSPNSVLIGHGFLGQRIGPSGKPMPGRDGTSYLLPF